MARWCLLLILCHADIFGQGLIVFNNRVLNDVVAPVYNLELTNPALAKVGNTGSGIPAGAQVYSGAPLSDVAYTAQLFAGATGGALVPLWPQVAFRTGDAAGFIVPPNMAVAVPGVAEGEQARIQLRAWNNRSGTITNWSQVMADPTVPHGESLPFISLPLGGVFTPPPNLAGLQSFSLVTPVWFGSPKYTAGQRFDFAYRNASAISYRVQVSETLTNWTTIATIAPGAGTVSDVFTHNSPRRFYRAVPPESP